jgi:peptide methionine sulfoxide reductase MsrB
MRNARARAGAASAAEIQKPDEQWRKELAPQQHRVLRQGHTERPFTGEYVDNHGDGFSAARAAGANCSARVQSPIRARAGRASTSRPSPRRQKVTARLLL